MPFGPAELRKKICGVFDCNVNNKNVLPPEVCLRSFDCVASSFLLESACSTDDEFNKAVSHMASLIKPGGTLITYTTLEETYFNFDGITFPSYSITDAMFCSSLKAAGLEIFHKQIINLNESDCQISDCKLQGLYVAKKRHNSV